MNLLINQWMPVRRRSGPAWIAPWQLTDENDPALDLDASRPDFNAALWQFCIGLLATLLPYADETERRQRLNSAPGPQTLKVLFESHAHAFELDGDGPRFMQDFDAVMDGLTASVAGLLIDSPGEKTVRDNSDHFVKRDRVEAMCPACAALALFTLQTNAPAGGAGHRTSLRGGGPLTTLVRFAPQARIDGAEPTLWHQLWLNVPRQSGRMPAAEAWPWMAPTRTSQQGEVVTPIDSHPATVFWASPRRIRLEFAYSPASCDLCGRRDESHVRRYVTRPHGANYSGWMHPLSPYYRINPDEDWLPQHPQPGGLGYRHWPALLYGNADGTARPATVIDAARDFARRLGPGWNPGVPLRLWAFGFDMDNMKARSWHEADMPILAVDDPDQLEIYAGLLHQLVAAAGLVRLYTTGAVRQAWFGGRDAKGDLSAVDRAFWVRTESAFFHLAARVREAIVADGNDEPLRRQWLEIIRRAAREAFDERAAYMDFAESDAAVLATAYNDLQKKLRGKKLLGVLGLEAEAKPGDRHGRSKA